MSTALAGLKKYLARTKTLAELETYADELFAIADETVILTSGGFEGGSHSGQVQSYNRAEILDVVEDLIRGLDSTITDPAPRRLLVISDWSGTNAQL